VVVQCAYRSLANCRRTGLIMTVPLYSHNPKKFRFLQALNGIQMWKGGASDKVSKRKCWMFALSSLDFYSQFYFITSAEGGYVSSSFCLSVCLSVRRITEKAVNKFWRNFLEGLGHGPGTNEFNFGDDPDHRPDPGVRNPDLLHYRKSYHQILMKFYGELGCGPRPTDYILVTIHITI